MANFERKYNQESGGFDFFVDGNQVDQNAYTEANGGNWWVTLNGSNRKEDNLKLGSLLEGSGVADRGKSLGVLQSEDFNKIGSMEDQEGFTQRMMKVMDKQSQDVQGEAVLNSLRKRLEGQEVTGDELKNLPIDIRQQVQSGNIAKIASEMGRIRGQMQGRAQAKSQAFDFVVNRYDKMVAQAQMEKQQELENFRYTLENFGPEAFSDLSPQQVGRLEMELGVKNGTINSQLEGARKIKAEQERLRLEAEAKEQARYEEEKAFRDKQFARSNMEADRNFALSARKASSNNSSNSAQPKQWGKMERFKDENLSNELGQENAESIRFTDPTGAPVPMFEYFQNNTGGDINQSISNMLSTLRSSHSGDKDMARKLEDELAKNGGQEISDQFVNKYWWLFKR
jgi:hypothetical protein